MVNMQRIVPRIVMANEQSELFASTHLILTIPTPLALIDSFAVMPGLGEHNRVIAAIKAWETHQQARQLLVSGTYPGETTQPQLTLERLQEKPFTIARMPGVITQVSAAHTRIQTDWIISKVKSHNITSLALFVSHWHLPRAYRTVLKSMLNADLRIPLFPVAIDSAPDELVPEYHETVQNLSAGEAQRIKTYQASGQIASFIELTEYLNWLWAQQIVPLKR